jgi:curved DNA-binding protein CbpA
MTVDHYRRLGVTRTASHDEIRRAYRRMARRLHPDTHGGAVDPEMIAVNEAWRVLSDKSRRSAYDAKLRGESTTPPRASYSASNPPPPPTEWRPFVDGRDRDDDFVDDDAFFDRHIDTAASRRWMVLITFTMVAAAVLLTALFVYAFIRSGSTGR